MQESTNKQLSKSCFKSYVMVKMLLSWFNSVLKTVLHSLHKPSPATSFSLSDRDMATLFWPVFWQFPISTKSSTRSHLNFLDVSVWCACEGPCSSALSVWQLWVSPRRQEGDRGRALHPGHQPVPPTFIWHHSILITSLRLRWISKFVLWNERVLEQKRKPVPNVKVFPGNK